MEAAISHLKTPRQWAYTVTKPISERCEQQGLCPAHKAMKYVIPEQEEQQGASWHWPYLRGIARGRRPGPLHTPQLHSSIIATCRNTVRVSGAPSYGSNLPVMTV